MGSVLLLLLVVVLLLVNCTTADLNEFKSAMYRLIVRQRNERNLRNAEVGGFIGIGVVKHVQLQSLHTQVAQKNVTARLSSTIPNELFH